MYRFEVCSFLLFVQLDEVKDGDIVCFQRLVHVHVLVCQTNNLILVGLSMILFTCSVCPSLRFTFSPYLHAHIHVHCMYCTCSICHFCTLTFLPGSIILVDLISMLQNLSYLLLHSITGQPLYCLNYWCNTV